MDPLGCIKVLYVRPTLCSYRQFRLDKHLKNVIKIGIEIFPTEIFGSRNQIRIIGSDVRPDTHFFPNVSSIN